MVYQQGEHKKAMVIERSYNCTFGGTVLAK